MSDTNSNTPNVDELQAKHAAFAASVRTALALGDDADEAAILAALGTTTKERDDANARAADVESRWAGEKVETALRMAFERSGAKPEHAEDFLLLARGLFTVDAKTGRVETKADAANTVPATDPTAWIHSELKAKRPHYWPGNVSGGARGGGVTTDAQGDTSCFKPGRTWNLTRQFEYEAKYGSIAADSARRRYGGGR